MAEQQRCATRVQQFTVVRPESIFLRLGPGYKDLELGLKSPGLGVKLGTIGL